MTISHSDIGPLELLAFPISAKGAVSLGTVETSEIVIPAAPEVLTGSVEAHLVPAPCLYEDAARVPLDELAACVAVSNPIGGLTKRSMDILIASITLIAVSPLMLLIALLIKARGGEVLFVHPRIGFGGKSFNCYKFRTMCPDPAQVLAAHLHAHPEAQAEWSARRKLSRDPRVTLLGQILRRASLDELPQLFNVLRGEMSCVGPRPVMADELARYGEFAQEYLRTRPGLTGLWQVNGRNTVDYSRRVELDGLYVRSWCIRSDLSILLRTIFAVARFNETC